MSEFEEKNPDAGIDLQTPNGEDGVLSSNFPDIKLQGTSSTLATSQGIGKDVPRSQRTSMRNPYISPI